jgi:hypothetical protein
MNALGLTNEYCSKELDEEATRWHKRMNTAAKSWMEKW